MEKKELCKELRKLMSDFCRQCCKERDEGCECCPLDSSYELVKNTENEEDD